MSEGETTQPSNTEAEMMRWARHEREVANWTRENGQSLGIDPGKYILGQLISAIDDDGSCFLYIDSGSSEHLRINRAALLERLDWETSDETPETPDLIRKKLGDVKKLIQVEEWVDDESVERARSTWQDARNFVKAEKNRDVNLQEAVKYHLNNQTLVGTHFPGQN